MRSAALAITLACLVAPTAARADSLDEMFARANEAYFHGDYEAAAEGYAQLEELGVRDADVAYNLATAEARQGHYGRAIRHYERALWLRPGDDGAAEGLDAARSALGRMRAARMGEAEIDTGPPLAEALFGGVSRDALAIATWLLLLGLCGAILGLLFVRHEGRRLALGIATPLLAIGLGVSALGWSLRAGALDDGEPAVVLVERASLRDAPSEEAAELGRQLEGERAWILEESDGWALVRTRAAEGWLPADEVGRVRPPEE